VNKKFVPTSKRNNVYLYCSESSGNIKSFAPVERSQRERIIIIINTNEKVKINKELNYGPKVQIE
jgi:hypothetical protein